MPVGEHALAGALRYFASGNLIRRAPGRGGRAHDSSRGRRRPRSPTAASFESMKPSDVVVAHHGIYAPQGIVAALRASTRHSRRDLEPCLPAAMLHLQPWRDVSPFADGRADRALGQRAAAPRRSASSSSTICEAVRTRRRRLDQLSQAAGHEVATGLRELGLDPAKPLIAAYTNVFWDAQLHYPQNAFAGPAGMAGADDPLLRKPARPAACHPHSSGRGHAAVPVSRQRARGRDREELSAPAVQCGRDRSRKRAVLLSACGSCRRRSDLRRPRWASSWLHAACR